MKRTLGSLCGVAAVVVASLVFAAPAAEARDYSLETNWSAPLSESPDVLIAMSDGGAFVVDNLRHSIGKVDADGTVHAGFARLSDDEFILSASETRGGEAVFCGSGDSGIFALSPDGTRRTVVAPEAGLGLGRCTSDDLGNVYFTRPDVGQIGRVDPAGAVNPDWAVLPPLATPMFVAVGADLAVYTAEESGAVYRIARDSRQARVVVDSADGACTRDFDVVGDSVYVTDPCLGGLSQHRMDGTLVRTVVLPPIEGDIYQTEASPQGAIFLRAANSSVLWLVPEKDHSATTPTMAYGFAAPVASIAMRDNGDVLAVSGLVIHRVEVTFDIWPDTGAAATVGLPYDDRYFTDSPFWATLSVTAGALPPGLTLDGPTGILSGTPTRAGTYTFDLTAENLKTRPITKTFTVVVNP